MSNQFFFNICNLSSGYSPLQAHIYLAASTSADTNAQSVACSTIPTYDDEATVPSLACLPALPTYDGGTAVPSLACLPAFPTKFHFPYKSPSPPLLFVSHSGDQE